MRIKHIRLPKGFKHFQAVTFVNFLTVRNQVYRYFNLFDDAMLCIIFTIFSIYF